MIAFNDLMLSARTSELVISFFAYAKDDRAENNVHLHHDANMLRIELRDA